MDNKNGYYIDGKKQAIELLQQLEGDERNKLLHNMSIRNASMARELSEKSYSFKDLFGADDETLEKITQVTTPAIIGLALYLTPKSFQRKILTIMPRDRAEQAFNIMSKDLTSKRQECFKAQNKILTNAIELSRKSIIKLSA